MIGCHFSIKEPLNRIKVTFLYKKSLKIIFQSLLLVVLFTTFILPEESYAQQNGIGRVRSCDADGNPSALLSGLQTTPLIGDSPDLNFDLSNGVCLAIAIGAYATVKAAIAFMNKQCGTGGSIRVTPSILQDFVDISRATVKATTTSNAECAGAVALSGIAIGDFIGILAFDYLVAEQVYKDTSICGSDWRKPNPNKYDFSKLGYQQDVNEEVAAHIEDGDSAFLSFDNKMYREWYYGGKEVTDNPYGYGINGIGYISDVDGNIDASGSVDVNVDTDSTDWHVGETPCLDPSNSAPGSSYPRQKYYMKGTQTANFNCQKYQIFAGQDDPFTKSTITSTRVYEFKKAYNCCMERSRNYICIDLAGEQTFCKAGSRCNLKNVGSDVTITFEATREETNLICAASYSLCPYNFAIGGGSRTCDYYKDGKKDSNGNWKMISEEQVADGIENGGCADKSEVRDNNCKLTEKAGKCRNYCQQLTHCTITPDAPYVQESDLNSPYFSSACYDFIGDSRNEIAYNGGVILGSQRHFSAPIAQCVKETLENVFYNKFGHSKCLSSSEYPSPDGVCASNNYQNYDISNVSYKKGDYVNDISFFATLQKNLQSFIKIALTLSVMMYGMKVLLAVGEIKRTDLVVFLAKISLVIFFATGTAWQDYFFKGVYGTSSVLSEIVFKIDAGDNEFKRDGCQFGDVTTDSSGTTINSATRAYPDGKSYLALWDTLDCKIARYLGFGPEASAANIAKLIFAGFFTGPYGLYFALSLMFFGFFFIAVTIRALHIFLSSAASIIIMVYISPVVITAVLFKKTANLFQGWLTQLIGFCLQPMILFAYIAIFITIMDKTLVGDATYHGTGVNKTISCAEYCADSSGSKILKDDDPECDDIGNEIIDPMDNSFACLININSFGTFPGLEIIGVSIPIITNVFDGNIKEKILTLVKAALIMFILCQFVDQIPGMASYLMGGAGLSPGVSVFGNAKNMMGSVMGASRAIQKRGVRGVGQAKKEGVNRAKAIMNQSNE